MKQKYLVCKLLILEGIDKNYYCSTPGVISQGLASQMAAGVENPAITFLPGEFKIVEEEF